MELSNTFTDVEIANNKPTAKILKQRLYREKNKDQLNAYMRNYYANNKEKWKKPAHPTQYVTDEKMTCEVCKNKFGVRYKKKHELSKIHIRCLELTER